MNQPQYGSLRFDEAIAFFRQKVPMPTERWTDLWKDMHARGFAVAGAMKTDLLTDLHAAVDKAIAQGTTLAEFRKDFDATVKRNGWTYNGSRGWRTALIYNTNTTTAYAAGRWKQMTDPELVEHRPFLEYRHRDISRNPRKQHLSWHGLVLPYDDPWWDTHYPPNGWGCNCFVRSLARRDLDRMGKAGPDTAPDDGTYEWTDKKTGKTHTIPKGIDPGWDYNVGKAAFGQHIAEETMLAWKRSKAGAWERLTPGDWQSEGRPEMAPMDAPGAAIDYQAEQSIPGLEKQISAILGGPQKTFSFSAGAFRHDINVNAKALAEHVDPARAKYLPFLTETLEEPFEVWMAFERHKGTGEVILRQRIIKAVKIGKKKGMIVVTNAVGGKMEAWTVIPSQNSSYMQKQRQGKLIWKREDLAPHSGAGSGA